jgi:hypothetical protein
VFVGSDCESGARCIVFRHTPNVSRVHLCAEHVSCARIRTRVCAYVRTINQKKIADDWHVASDGCAVTKRDGGVLWLETITRYLIGVLVV